MNVNVFETGQIAVKFVLNLLQAKLKNCNVVTVNINLKVTSLTRILMVNYPTSNWVHAFVVVYIYCNLYLVKNIFKLI